MAKSLYANPHHLALIVKDMDKAVNYYLSLGMGPFITAPPIVFTRRTRGGKPIAPGISEIKEVIGNMGAVRLQLIQPVKGDSIFKEFLDTRGEGAHHYAFLVDDIEKEEAKFVHKGVEILSSVRVEGGGGHIIINTGKSGGLFVELIQAPAEWLAKCPPLSINQ